MVRSYRRRQCILGLIDRQNLCLILAISLLLRALLHVLEQLAWDDHRLIATVPLAVLIDIQVEESVLERGSDRIVAASFCFAAGCPTMVILDLLLVMSSDRLLASVAWWFLFTSLKVKAQVRRGSVSS